MVHIVLVEPQIPQNTGNIARTCAATGSVLHLIRPMGFTVTDAKLKRAGLDYWHLLDIRYHDSLDAFFEAEQPMHCYFATTKARRAHSAPVYEEDCYLLFGREDQGLPEALLARYREYCVRIPQREEARSLNLSNSVAVMVYEVLRQQGYPGLLTDFGLF